jgi:hypothetical protein
MKTCPNCFTENINTAGCNECPAVWPDETEFYLTDHHGRQLFCRVCGNEKLKSKCNEVEFSCGGEDHACAGWRGACCSCGMDYAKGQ